MKNKTSYERQHTFFFRQILWLVSGLLLFGLAAIAQPAAQGGEKAQIQADQLEQVIIDGQKVRKFTGNVILEQKGQTLYAQEGFQFIDQDRTVFKGGVRIVQPDGQTITGDSLIFTNKSRVAKVRGNVVYTEATRTLTTQTLDYDIESGNATYENGGTINDNGTILNSTRGVYNKGTGRMNFFGRVSMKGPEMDLTTDTLLYNTNDKMADFFGPTIIKNKDGIVRATKGTYNTETGKGIFKGRSVVDTEDYTITGDKIDFDRQKQDGKAAGNVVIFSKKDSLMLYGNRAIFSQAKNIAKVYENALLKVPGDGKDTLYIKSDSMSANSNAAKTERTMLAMGRVKIYNADLQAIADSLAYQTKDSSIYFFQNPVLWTGKNQLSADTIVARLNQKNIDSLILIRNSFVISQDTLGNYNQVKGRRMYADFNNKKLKKVDVVGNGQSLFFAVDEEKMELTGLNRLICSNMIVRFDSASKVETLTALVKPEATFTPPQLIADPDKKLKGYNWHPTDRPSKESVLGVQAPNDAKTKKIVPKPKKARIIKKKKAAKPKKTSQPQKTK